MAKTYNTFTNVSTGDVLTATNFNNVLTNVGNYRVPPMVRVSRITTAYSVTAGASGWLEFNSENYDTDGMHDNSVNPSYLTAQTAGVYFLSAGAIFDFTGSATAAQMVITHTTANGATTTIIADNYAAVASNASVYANMNMNGIYEAAVGDYFRVRLGVLTGATGVTLRTGQASFFAATWLGQVS